MRYEDFLSKISIFPGVVRCELLPQDLMRNVMDLEYSPKNIGFTPVDPEGIKEISSKNLNMVLFCNRDFPMFTQPCMDILDQNGRIIGFDILERDKHIFKSENFIWLTDNLFIDSSRLDTRGSLRTVIHSLSLNMPDVPADICPRVYYPSAEAARYLNKCYNVNTKVLSTVLLGVDLQPVQETSEMNISG